MKTRMMLAAIVVAFGGVGGALADDDCEARIGDWQPRSAVVRMAEGRGWTVQRIKTDDGCYEILCTDVDGRSFEAIVDPATLAVLAIEHRSGDRERRGDRHGRSVRDGGDDDRERGGRHDRDDDDDDDDDDDRGAAVPPAGPSDPNAPVPDNGLFKGKVRPKVQVH